MNEIEKRAKSVATRFRIRRRDQNNEFEDQVCKNYRMRLDVLFNERRGLTDSNRCRQIDRERKKVARALKRRRLAGKRNPKEPLVLEN